MRASAAANCKLLDGGGDAHTYCSAVIQYSSDIAMGCMVSVRVL